MSAHRCLGAPKRCRLVAKTSLRSRRVSCCFGPADRSTILENSYSSGSSQLSRSTARPKLSKVETRVLALLVLSVAVNYIDRGALSVAAPQLTKELSLGPQMMGVLLSGLFWTYALSLILAGWLVG